MRDVVVLYTTWPDAETADKAAEAAVAEGLCACANRLGPLASIYRWRGSIELASEVPVLFKTSAARAEALERFLTERHPYETPCVLALNPSRAGSNPAFLDWIVAESTEQR
jgi:periplasmic divalent cation tolerance protein